MAIHDASISGLFLDSLSNLAHKHNSRTIIAFSMHQPSVFLLFLPIIIIIMFAKEDWSAKNGAETRKGAFLCRKKSVICKSELCVDESEAMKKKRN